MTESITKNLKGAGEKATKTGQKAAKTGQKAAETGQDQAAQAGKAGKGALSGVASQLPLDRLKSEAQGLGQAMLKHGLSRASGGVESLTGKLTDYAQGGAASALPKVAKNLAEGDSPAKAGVKAVASKAKDKVKEKLGMGGGGGGDKIKVTNILESVDVPVPRQVAYQQWTLFEDFPTFMKKVENVKQEEDEKLQWRAQVFWSHRSWNAEILDQVPNKRIVWKSDGDKGHVDGAVTFHELTPDLTRVQVLLEYHPKGLFEHTGNLWRAQGRRARLELKHFARHVSTRTLLHQDEVNGWTGEIRDGQVVEGEESEDQQQDQPQDQDRGTQEEKETGEDQGAKDQGAEDQQQEDQGAEDQGNEAEEGEEQQAQEQKPRPRPRKKAAGKASRSAGNKGPRRATSKASAS